VPVLLGACTLVGGGVAGPSTGPYPGSGEAVATPSPAPDETPGVRATDPGSAEARTTARVVSVAIRSIGTPYEWGGTDANGFDCSGLIQFAYEDVGIRLPRTSTAQMSAGAPVTPEPARLRPGDLLGFSADRSGQTDHVGLYIGSGEFIHSSSSGVRVSSLDNRYWRNSLVAARRIVG